MGKLELNWGYLCKELFQTMHNSNIFIALLFFIKVKYKILNRIDIFNQSIRRSILIKIKLFMIVQRQTIIKEVNLQGL